MFQHSMFFLLQIHDARVLIPFVIAFWQNYTKIRFNFDKNEFLPFDIGSCEHDHGEIYFRKTIQKRDF